MLYVILVCFEIIGKEPQGNVRLTGPTLIKTGEPVWIGCISNIPMTSNSVRFYVNNKLHKTLTKRENGCSSSVNSTCRPNECQCSAEGKTYLMKHGGFVRGGLILIECKMEFHSSLEMSDCMLIKVTGLYYIIKLLPSCRNTFSKEVL